MRLLSIEFIISITAAIAALLLLIFAVDWHYFRDWVAVFLFKCTIDSLWGTAVVVQNLLEYPFRQFPQYFKMSLLFEYWVFPILCVLYNHVTRTGSLWSILAYAVIFSTGITAIEYPLELYTDLIKYNQWSWFTTFYTLILTFLASRAFVAFYRWGCAYFGDKKF
jgi:hypothetical protein